MAHELNPDKSAELAAWARNVGIDLDPKANQMKQWRRLSYVSFPEASM
jgi:hypothetical protein